MFGIFICSHKKKWLLDRNCFRSESTLKSIKLQYGAEIDGWRAKYEEAQVKISENQRNTGENQCFQYFHCLSWFSFFRVFSPSCKTTLEIWRLKTGNSVLSIKVQTQQLSSILFFLLNKRLSDLDGGEGDYIILQGDKRQVPFRIRREQMIVEGIFRPIFGPKNFFKSGIWGLNVISRVEDKMGLLKERDQTIVTLETEISEVQEKI